MALKKEVNICLCLPHTFEQFEAEFSQSLWDMILCFQDWQRDKEIVYRLSYLVQDGFQLDTIRNSLAYNALQKNQDYLLFLDTDMSFPPETIVWMIEDFEDNEDQGLEIVTGLSVLKEPPYQPVVFPRFNPDTKKYEIAGTFPLEELFQVEGTGMACTMIARQVFDRLSWPYFKFVYKGQTEEFPYGIGEDLYFCYRANAFIVCDPRIQTGHLKKHPFTIDDYIKHNNLKKKDGGVEATAQQLRDIANSS